MASGITAPRGFEAVKALSKVTGRPIETLLALGRHADPFFAGSPAQTRDAEWFAEWWHQLGFHERRNVHVRGVHYKLVVLTDVREILRPDGRPYLNTDPCWEWLAAASAPARYLGLVDPECFTDRKNPPPQLYAGGPDPSRGDVGWTLWDEPGAGWSLPRIDADPGWLLDFGIPRPSVTGYGYAPADQPYLVECWVEKSTMNDVLEPVCQRFGINLVVSAGFQSITNARRLLQRAAAAGKAARVVYVSDFDPGGDLMPVAVARQLEFWLPDLAPQADLKLTPVVLTRDQVARYRLPRTPIKEEDGRRGKFEELYGEGAVELDALEALHPGELVRVLTEAVSPYFDPRLSRRLTVTEAQAQLRLNEAWAEATAHQRQALDAIEARARTITRRYGAELKRLNDALQEELAPLNDQLDAVRRDLQGVVDDFDVDLPDRPEPEVDPPDEAGWLYAADRTYLEQLAAFKGRRGEDVEEVVVYTDGLTTSQRQTLTVIRDAGGAVTARALGEALGIKAYPAVQRRINELVELGLVAPTGKGTKNDPRVWRVVEPGGDPGLVEEAAG